MAPFVYVIFDVGFLLTSSVVVRQICRPLYSEQSNDKDTPCIKV
jgi:hypothetical protein